MSTDILIERLMDEFAKFSENDDVNFMDCINPNENAHTRILIDLLRSNDEYLNSFIDYINSNYNFYLPKIDTNEKDFIIEHNKKNIDGLIKDSHTAIIIENKVKWAIDQGRQLERYVGKIFCGDDNFLIDIEDRITKEILEEIKKCCNTKLQKQLDSLINKEGKELICIIDELSNKGELVLQNLLEDKIEIYRATLSTEIKKYETNTNNIIIERKNIYVLYLVPNDIKDPSIYSYTTAAKIFLNDDVSSNGRFIKISYKQIVDWMLNYLKVSEEKTNLYNSVRLYCNHINNYIWQEKEKYKIMKAIFNDDYNKLRNCKEMLETENQNTKIENKNFMIKQEIIKTIDNYISSKLDDIFVLIKDITIKNAYAKIKAQKQHFFRFIPKDANIPKSKKSFNDWDRILGFEFKIKNENLVLSFCVISEDKWRIEDIDKNRKLIDKITENIKFLEKKEYENIKEYLKKYNYNKWIIESCFELSISELIDKQDNEIKEIIENNFLKNPKFKDFEESLNSAFQKR